MPERLTLSSADRTASLALTRLESNEHSVAVAVEATSEGFTGSNDRVYLWRHAVNQASADLVAFERTRSGAVAFYNSGEAGATNELSLWLRPRSGGHAVTRVRVLRLVHETSAAEVAFSFEVDGGDLPSFVSGWLRLMAAPGDPAA